MLTNRRAIRQAARAFRPFPIDVAARAPLLPHAPTFGAALHPLVEATWVRSSLGRLRPSMLTAIHVARFSTTVSSTATATASTERPVDLTSTDFVTLRAKDKAYVDKTSAIVDVLADDALSHRAFFSRPRRFGKSLTIDVMAEMLAAGQLPAGVKEWPGYEPVDVEGLFGGLAVHDRVMDKDPLACSVMERPHFVIKLPLGDAQTGAELKQAIIWQVAGIAGTAFGPVLEEKVLQAPTAGAAVNCLVRAVPKQVPIAVLVDEHDQAIINDVTEKQWPAAKQGVAALRSLMMATKAQDLSRRIQRFIVTGVARFARTSLFSGANNFTDLTGHPIASRMLGFTEDEIRTVFPSKLEALGRHVAGRVHGATLTAAEARDEAMKQLEFWHNGYCFDGTTSCYNPTPVLMALAAQRVASTTLEGSTAHGWLGVPPAALLAQGASRQVQSVVQNFDIADLEAQTVHPTALLLQTGLLTLKSLSPPSAAAALPAMRPTAGGGADGPPAAAAAGGDPVVTLQAPNEYARKTLLQLVAKATARELTWLSNEVERVRTALAARDHAAFGKILVELLTGIPHPMTRMKGAGDAQAPADGATGDAQAPADGTTGDASAGDAQAPADGTTGDASAGDAQAPADGTTGDASAPAPPREAPYHTAVYGFLRAAVPHQLGSLEAERQAQFGTTDIELQLKPLGGRPEERWILELGVVAAEKTPTAQLVAKKLQQVQGYYKQYASKPGKVAAVVVNRDAKEVVVQWREWTGAGGVWKDLPEQ